MGTTRVEARPAWQRLRAEQPLTLRRLQAIAVDSTGLREPERFAPLCEAWGALDMVERRTALALLDADTKVDGSPLSDDEAPSLSLVEIPSGGLSTCRPDLAVVWINVVLGIVQLHCAIEAKSRSLAARNASTILAALGTDAIEQVPEQLRSLCFLDADHRWRLDQLHVYLRGRWLPVGWVGHESASWTLLTPGASYTEDGWSACDAEALVALLLDLFLRRPRQELLGAVAAYIAPPAMHPYRALSTSKGRLRNTASFGWRWSWAAWRRELAWVSHTERFLRIGFSDTRGWELLYPDGEPVLDVSALPAELQEEADHWARDLKAASTGDRASWVPCAFPECEKGLACTQHCDRFGTVLQERPGWAAPAGRRGVPGDASPAAAGAAAGAVA